VELEHRGSPGWRICVCYNESGEVDYWNPRLNASESDIKWASDKYGADKQHIRGTGLIRSVTLLSGDRVEQATRLE
jgi:hypothetical protein